LKIQKKSNNLQEFLDHINIIKTRKIIKNKKQTVKQISPNENYPNPITKINEQIKSSNSKDAYNLIKIITILNEEKRDGGIFNHYINQDNLIITD